MIGRQTWPNLPVYDENGYYFNSNADTPAMQLALGGIRTKQRDQLYQQAAVIIEPIKNWFTHVEFNYSTDNDEVRQTNLPYYNHKVNGDIDNTNGTSSLYQSLIKNNYMNWNIYSDYSWTMNERLCSVSSPKRCVNLHSGLAVMVFRTRSSPNLTLSPACKATVKNVIPT